MRKPTNEEVQKAINILFGSSGTEIAMHISDPDVCVTKVIQKPGIKIDLIITNKEPDWYASFRMDSPVITFAPACCCSEKLDLLRELLGNNDRDMEEARKNDGPYWVRKLAMNFIILLEQELEISECKCSAAIRMNAIHTYIQSDKVKDFVECRGGGSAEQRAYQEKAYEDVKYLLRRSCIWVE